MIDVDEMYAPGGLTWDEPTAMPLLADFECGHCGQIGRHDDGCPNDYTKEAAVAERDVPTCKIDGCENEPLQRMGKYAGLCADHRPSNGNGSIDHDRLRPPSERLVIDDAARKILGLEGPTSMGEIEAEGREQYEQFEQLHGGELVQAARKVERLHQELAEAIVDLRSATARLA